MFSLKNKKIWVTGHQGMVGSAVCRRLQQEPTCQIMTTTRQEVDLTRQDAVETWLKTYKPDALILAAARVGGIGANAAYPADFLYENLTIASNIIHGAWKANVHKLLFLGSSCIYPRMAPQPIVEEALLSGPLEPTNEWYAVAKIAGLKMCQAYRRQYGCDFISVMPTNLYGPGDTYHLENSHVLPSLILKIHTAYSNNLPTVALWGTGTPRREFLYVDDLADALVHLMETYSDDKIINIGTGVDITIDALARQIAAVIGYQGDFQYHPDKPDGTPRKLLDVSRLHQLGWQAKTSLEEGITLTYQEFLKEQS